MKKKGIIIGISGGSGSGKTLVAANILRSLTSEHVCIIEEDSYYNDLAGIPVEMRQKFNFDHPDAFDHEYMREQLLALAAGEEVKVPIYDYTTHTRSGNFRKIGPHHIVIVEGILLLYEKAMRDVMDIKIYVDTPLDICFLRRLRRDITERGRTVESVMEQYETTVRPMFMQFIEPSKRYADVIVPMGGKNEVAIDLITTKINQLLKDHFTG